MKTNCIPFRKFGHNPDSLPKKCLHVFNDQSATANLAARELLQTGYANFAFVPSKGKRAWSDARGKAFSDAIALNGKPCAMHAPPARRTDALGRIRSLKRFLASLEKPCAVFAANDRTGADVPAAAKPARPCPFFNPHDAHEVCSLQTAPNSV